MSTVPIIKFTADFQALTRANTVKSLVNSKQVLVATVGPPIITFGTTMDYEPTYNDGGSGAHMNGAFYRPVAPQGFYILGDYAQGDYRAPSRPSITIAVENDDPKHPVLTPPQSYSQIWNDKGSGAHMDGSIWAPVPRPGYVALGAVCAQGYSQPSIPQLMCIRFDLVQAGQIGALIWNDRGSGAHEDVGVYLIDELGTFYAQGDYNPPRGPVWIPRAFVNALRPSAPNNV